MVQILQFHSSSLVWFQTATSMILLLVTCRRAERMHIESCSTGSSWFLWWLCQSGSRNCLLSANREKVFTRDKMAKRSWSGSLWLWSERRHKRFGGKCGFYCFLCVSFVLSQLVAFCFFAAFCFSPTHFLYSLPSASLSSVLRGGGGWTWVLLIGLLINCLLGSAKQREGSDFRGSLKAETPPAGISDDVWIQTGQHAHA